MLSIRKIGVVGRTYRHLNRYRQILAVLFKYGFGDLVDLLRIEQYIEIGLQLISRKDGVRQERLSRAVRIRLAIEELGPCFIKLGQVLSTRPDLVPAEFVDELVKLQDRVPPADPAQSRRLVETELEGGIDTIFARFDELPLASGSIAQVFRARLTDGEAVAVKVQRPGIRRLIEVDLEIMLHLATLMERHIEEMALHRPVQIVEEFARTLEKEIDFSIEAASMKRMARHFLDDPTVFIPAVHDRLSTGRVLTMEFVEGIKISRTEALDAAGMDRREITRRGADFYLRQIFQFGFFHADPHPGNIFVLPGAVICPLDFGMTGSVDRQSREDFVDLIDAVVHQNEARAVQVLLRITRWEQLPDQRLLERDLAEFMARHLYKPLGEIEIGRLLNNLLELAAYHRMRIPPDLFLMMKALTTVEGVARALDPAFDMVGQTAPFVEATRLRRFHPQRIATDLAGVGGELLHFLQELPRDLVHLRLLIQQHKLTLRVENSDLDTVLSTHDQISNRISFSIIIAALLIGSALIVISKTPPLFYGISVIGIIGFLAAAVMGIWLLIAILRSGQL